LVVVWFMAKRKSDGSAGATRKQTILSKPSDPVRARSDLVQQVQSGAMTPKDAETQAERLGIAPLIAQPDPAKFDPMSEVAWTLPMVAAWIRFRSLDEVREQWDPYRNEIRYWRKFEGGGWELAARQPATLPHMFLSDEPISSTHDIKEAGRAGRIRATGTCTRTNERREIQAIEWQDLEHTQTSGDRDALRIRRHKAISFQGYDDIVFFRDEILEEWPSADSIDDSRFYRLPEAEPRRGKPKEAYRALKLKYPDGRVPKLSIEALVRVLNQRPKMIGHEPTNRDAVLRALGKK